MLLIRILTAPLRLGSRSAMLGVRLSATALASPSVGTERALDDWIVGLQAEGRGHEVGLSTGLGDCFGRGVLLPREDTGAVLAQSAVSGWRRDASPAVARNP